ncbi:hypothetical protein YPPY92_0433, partial [Yersinia pestis PY-92]
MHTPPRQPITPVAGGDL